MCDKILCSLRGIVLTLQFLVVQDHSEIGLSQIQLSLRLGLVTFAIGLKDLLKRSSKTIMTKSGSFSCLTSDTVFQREERPFSYYGNRNYVPRNK